MEKVKDQILVYKNILRDNITILVFIPTLLGGIHQAIQIVAISPSLIKFFSISQLVIDGIFILSYATFVMLLPILVSKPLMSFTKNIRPIISKRLLLLIILLNVVYMFLILKHNSSLIENTTLDFLSQILQFFLIGCGINIHSNVSSESTKFDRYYIVFIMILGIILSSLMVIRLSQKIPIANFEILEKKYQDKGKIEVLYFNDQFIFLKTECDNRNEKIYIEKVDVLFTKN